MHSYHEILFTKSIDTRNNLDESKDKYAEKERKKERKKEREKERKRERRKEIQACYPSMTSQ